jgi:hypothetical protein
MGISGLSNLFSATFSSAVRARRIKQMPRIWDMRFFAHNKPGFYRKNRGFAQRLRWGAARATFVGARTIFFAGK